MGVLTQEEIEALRREIAASREEERRLSAAQMASRDVAPPEQAARDIARADEAGVLPAQVEVDRDAYEMRAMGERLERMATETPRLDAWLKSEDGLYAAARDDLDNLAWWEQALRAVGNTPKAIGAAVPGYLESFAGGVQALAEIGDEYLRSPAPLAFSSRVRMQDGFVDRTPAETSALSQAAANADKFRQQMKKLSDDAMPTEGGVVEQGYYGFLRSAAMMVPAFGSAIATGNPAGVLPYLGAVTGGASYGDARDAGLGVMDSAGYGAVQGSIEMATELIPVGKFFADIEQNTGIAKRFLNSVLSDVPGEMVATTLQGLNEAATLTPEKPLSEFWAELPDELAKTVVASLFMSGASAAGGRAISMAETRARIAATEKEASDLKDTFIALGDAALKTKLLQRLPKRFRDYVEAQTKDGDKAEVRIDADQLRPLYQADGSLRAAFDLAGVTEADIETAVETGGDVIVRTSDFATYIAGDRANGPAWTSQLAEHMRFDMHKPTPSQASALREAFEEITREQFEEKNVEAGFADARDRIQQDLVKTYRGAGLDKRQAQVNAELNASMITMMALKDNVDPWEFYTREAPVVRGEVDGEQIEGGLSQGDGAKAPIFYSALERAVTSSKMPRAPGAQWLATLKNTTGIKAEELEWTGAAEWLATQDGPVTKEALAEFVRAGGVKIEVLGRVNSTAAAKAEEVYKRAAAEINRTYARDSEEAGRVYRDATDSAYEALAAIDAPALEIYEAAVEAADLAYLAAADAADAEYEATITAGGPAVIADAKAAYDQAIERARLESRAVVDEARRVYNETIASAQRAYDQAEEAAQPAYEQAIERARQRQADALNEARQASENAFAEALKSKADEGLQTDLYKEVGTPRYGEHTLEGGWDYQELLLTIPGKAGGFVDRHFPTTGDLVAHLRVKTRQTDDGRKVLAIEEIQSFLHQEAEKRGYQSADNRSGAPNAPFKNNAWVDLVLKYAVRYAVENGFDELAWIPGEIQNGKRHNETDNRDHFYDRIVRNAASKLGKKHGAAVGKLDLGTVIAGEPVIWWSMPITDSLREQALGGQPLFQREEGPRGYFLPGREDVRPIIQLFNTRDPSTLAHESAHWYLDALYRMANGPNASAWASEELSVILEWAGESQDLQLYFPSGRPTDAGRRVHEMFAQSWEAYLREGKAPTSRLRRAFQSMLIWLTDWYKTLRSLPLANVTPEMRALFDGMLAAREEIAHARRPMEIDASRLMSVMVAKGKMSEKQKARFETAYRSAYVEAEAEWLRSAMQRYIDDFEAGQEDRLRQIRNEVRREIDQRPEMRLRDYLSTGKWYGELQKGQADPDDDADVLSQARAEGYEGDDIGEAMEWRQAAAKGLDLSKEARMQRAAALGFDTSNILYHGTPRNVRAFNLRMAGANSGSPEERAIYLTPDAGDAANYADDGGVVMPLIVRGRYKTVSAADLPDLAKGDELTYGSTSFARELEKARDEGFDGVRFEKVRERFRAGVDQIAVFDPSNIRSVNAAFDPEEAGSANLLAQGPLDDGIKSAMAIKRTPNKLTIGMKSSDKTAEGGVRQRNDIKITADLISDVEADVAFTFRGRHGGVGDYTKKAAAEGLRVFRQARAGLQYLLMEGGLDRLIFYGATDSHTKLYRFMLQTLRWPGFATYEVSSSVQQWTRRAGSEDWSLFLETDTDTTFEIVRIGTEVAELDPLVVSDEITQGVWNGEQREIRTYRRKKTTVLSSTPDTGGAIRGMAEQPSFPGGGGGGAADAGGDAAGGPAYLEQSAQADDAPRALFQGRSLDEMGFYSAALESARAIPDNIWKQGWQAARSALAKGSGGVAPRKTELQYLGIDGVFGDSRLKGSELREAVLAHIEAKRLVLVDRWDSTTNAGYKLVRSRGEIRLPSRDEPLFEWVLALPEGVPGSDYRAPSGHIGSKMRGTLVTLHGEERADDRGQRTLFTGQVQSDQAQQRRAEKKETGEGAPMVPLMETSEWTSVALRAALYRAARDGFDSVSFPTGDTSEFIQGNDDAARHYDTNVKGVLEKLAAQLGGKVRVGDVAISNMVEQSVSTVNDTVYEEEYARRWPAVKEEKYKALQAKSNQEFEERKKRIEDAIAQRRAIELEKPDHGSVGEMPSDRHTKEEVEAARREYEAFKTPLLEKKRTQAAALRAEYGVGATDDTTPYPELRAKLRSLELDFQGAMAGAQQKWNDVLANKAPQQRVLLWRQAIARNERQFEEDKAERLKIAEKKIAEAEAVVVGHGPSELNELSAERAAARSAALRVATRTITEWVENEHLPTEAEAYILAITPEIRAKILEGGFPLFQQPGSSRAPRWGSVTPPADIPRMRLDLDAVRRDYGPNGVAMIPPDVWRASAQGVDLQKNLDLVRSIKADLKLKKPHSLTGLLRTTRRVGSGSAVVKYRGIRDPDGELAAILDTSSIGVIATGAKDTRTQKSMSLEEAALWAWEEGYFLGADPPTINEFIDAIRRDQIKPIYRAADAETISRREAAEAWAEWFDEMGIDVTASIPEVAKRIAEVGSSEMDNAMSPDQIAPFFGFRSGGDLLQGLKASSDRQKLIDDEVQRRMIERFGQPDRAALERAAEIWARNELQANAFELELEAMARAAGVLSASRFAKAEAQERLRSMTVKQVLNYGGFLEAERRWSRAAIKAAEEDDFTNAMVYKQRQLINMHLYNEGKKIAEELEKTREFLLSFEKKEKRQRLYKAGEEYVDHMDALLEAYNLRKESGRAIERRAALAEWLRAQSEADPLAAYAQPGLTDNERIAEAEEAIARNALLSRLSEGVEARNWVTLPVSEFLLARDQAEAIWHFATLKDKLLKARERRRLGALANDIAVSIEDNQPRERPPEPLASMSPRVSSRRERAAFWLEHRTLQGMARAFDGGADGGQFWAAIVRPMNEAFASRTLMMKQAELDVSALYRRHLGERVNILRADFITIPGVEQPMALSERLSVALHWGTETNRRRVMDGEGWSEETVRGILDTLEERDWDFVQAVWDYIGGYYEEANRVHKAVHGASMVKEKALQVATKFGVREGGYFPIIFDAYRSSRASQQALETDARVATARVDARKKASFTKERVKGKVTLPILLDVQAALGRHLDKVITSISTEEMFYDVGRLIRHPVVEDAVVRRHGRGAYEAIVSAIREARQGQQVARAGIERALTRLRNGATIVGLGLNFMTALKQVLGATNSLVRLGDRKTGSIGGVYWLARGVARMGMGVEAHASALEFVSNASAFMRGRRLSQNRELADIRNRIDLGSVRGGVRNVIDAGSMWAIVQTQYYAVDVPLWFGAYEKALARGQTETDAILLADQAVIDAQGAGEVYQLAGLQRGSPLQKIFTNFLSYQVTTWNLALSRTAGTNFRSPAEALAWGLDMLVLYSVPVVGTILVNGLMGMGGDEDEDPFLEEYVRQQIGFLLSTFGIVGQSAGALSGFDYSGPQGTRAIGDLNRSIQAAAKDVERVGEGEAPTGGFVRPFFLAAGAWYHFPAGQVDKTVRGASALATGETEDWRALITGPQEQAG